MHGCCGTQCLLITKGSFAFALLLSFRFDGMGTLFSNKEVRTTELAVGGLLFTGDCSGQLKVWRWAPEDQEAEADAHS